MADQLPPDWAIEKAMGHSYRGSGWSAETVKSYGEGIPLAKVILDFARYIAQHEEARVDPVVLEARSILSLQYNIARYPAQAAEVDEGNCDDGSEMTMLVKALRRGIEIGKAS